MKQWFPPSSLAADTLTNQRSKRVERQKFTEKVQKKNIQRETDTVQYRAQHVESDDVCGDSGSEAFCDSVEGNMKPAGFYPSDGDWGQN